MDAEHRSSVDRRHLETLADHLESRSDWLVDVQLPELTAFPSYAEVARADLRRSGRRNALRLVATLRGVEDDLPGGTELEHATGRARAAQGIPVDEVVGFVRAVYARLGDVVVQTAEELGLGAETTLEGMRRLWRTADRSTSELLAGYHAEQLRAATHREGARAAFVMSLVHGAASGVETPGTLQYGIDASHRYHLVRTTPPSGEAAAREMRRRLERACRDDTFEPLVISMDGDLIGVSAVVPRSWSEDHPLVVSDAVVPADLPAQLRRTAQGITASHVFGLTGVVSTSWLSVRAAVLDRRDIGATLHDRYLAPLLEHKGGPELVRTLDVYLRHGRNVARTADHLIVHVNTVRYRLERAATLTGIDLEETDQVVELWWALAHHLLLTQEHRGRSGEALGSARA